MTHDNYPLSIHINTPVLNDSANNSKDSMLLNRLIKGDESALKEAVDLYYTSLCAFSVQFTEDEDESEDIVQDLFIRLWEKRLFDGISNHKMYLLISVRNMSIAMAKSHTCMEGLDQLESEVYAEWDEGFTEDEIRSRRQQLEESLRKLSPKEYEVLLGIIVHDKKYKEMAEEMNVSVNTVKIHLKRAMKKLRNTDLIFLVYFF